MFIKILMNINMPWEVPKDGEYTFYKLCMNYL